MIEFKTKVYNFENGECQIEISTQGGISTESRGFTQNVAIAFEEAYRQLLTKLAEKELSRGVK